MTDERDARDQLVKNWSRYPALAKEQCVKPQEYLPGYVEWMGTSRRASARQADTPSTKGPIVKYADDGSIDYVVNC